MNIHLIPSGCIYFITIYNKFTLYFQQFIGKNNVTNFIWTIKVIKMCSCLKKIKTVLKIVHELI